MKAMSCLVRADNSIHNKGGIDLFDMEASIPKLKKRVIVSLNLDQMEDGF
ncbi:MAG: hypothetical protein ABIH76_00860 [Candidatus Bathyarchaeota archaeon]